MALKLSTQLKTRFAMGLLVLAAALGMSWRVILKYEQTVVAETLRHIRMADSLARAESFLWRLRFGIPQFMVGDAELRKRILDEEPAHYRVVESSLDRYAKELDLDLDDTAAERAALGELRAAFLRYKEARPRFFELYLSGRIEEAARWNELTTMPYGASTVQAMQNQLQLALEHNEHNSRNTATVIAASRAALGAAVLLMLMLFAFLYFGALRVLRPIRQLHAQVVRVTREQFGETAGAGRAGNEIVQLADAFHVMTDKFLMRTAELGESQERFSQLLRSTPAVIWRSRADGGYARVFVSENVRQVLGYEPEEFTADPAFWQSHIHPDDRPRLLAGLPGEIESGRFVHEYRFRRRDGAWRWLQADATVVRDAAGRPESVIGYWIDITARIESEKEAQRVGKRLQLALEGGRIAIWDANTVTGEIFLSEHWAEMLGEPRRETRTTVNELLALAHPEDRQRLLDATLAVIKGERPDYVEEHRVRTAAGDWRWIESRGRVVERAPDGKATRMSGTNLDITPRKQAEDALRQVNRLKSEFMASVTHELRTPLNSVIGFAELLKDRVPGPLNAKQAVFAADILASGRQLLALVEGILEMSRLDAEGFTLAREPVEIAAALTERVAAHRAAAEARGLAWRLEVAPDAGSAQLDPKALRRMLDALLDNAVKFSREGGSVAVRARRGGDLLEIAVTDTGIGIAKEDLPRLFQPLAQLDASLARKHGGIGLSLALAGRLAALHGGTIEVESEPGKGSTFTLWLPAGETRT